MLGKNITLLCFNYITQKSLNNYFYSSWRADSIYKERAVMVKLEFLYGKEHGKWKLTSECKRNIANAQAVALRK